MKNLLKWLVLSLSIGTLASCAIDDPYNPYGYPYGNTQGYPPGYNSQASTGGPYPQGNQNDPLGNQNNPQGDPNNPFAGTNNPLASPGGYYNGPPSGDPSLGSLRSNDFPYDLIPDTITALNLPPKC